MTKNYEKKAGPVVSVLIPTFNRPQYFSIALASVLQQSYRNLQVIVINDGGEDVSDIINSHHDPRLIFINRKENRGKSYSLNEALNRADGKYVAYLDDDDLYYPNHIETLVNALEFQTDCQAAYSDFYKLQDFFGRQPAGAEQNCGCQPRLRPLYDAALQSCPARMPYAPPGPD